MVDLSIENDRLIVRVLGFSKLLALKSRISVPLSSVDRVNLDPNAAKGFWKGIRFPGTHMPGLLVAGTYYRLGKKAFWNVRRGRTALVIDLKDASYDQLVVEVRDVDAAVAMFRDARGQSR